MNITIYCDYGTPYSAFITLPVNKEINIRKYITKQLYKHRYWKIKNKKDIKEIFYRRVDIYGRNYIEDCPKYINVEKGDKFYITKRIKIVKNSYDNKNNETYMVGCVVLPSLL
ncbi:Hypothetical protein ORPV_496 [Orpheovirus IHUMI-LCC2]|uniref:Uncharacterized protein n=1 Tax=Orpheovirus IHUMI-LCC2 TaxID=2023057 RepID=A0A2I2L4H2_9VIRU|nr:Hypothetical protein ORPV_496 [Orpheovirus IHUMI-LCC2]SNW62400.1 Hypothetical protein ORPV_496 [Orpheovirus IHUMI-LCC2]